MAKRNGREATAAAMRSVPKIRRASSRREARRCRRWEVVILGEGLAVCDCLFDIVKAGRNLPLSVVPACFHIVVAVVAW